jgi:hypothetical protein
MEPLDVKVKIPAVLKPLFRKSRFKVLHGGRGSAKSWTIATVLIILAMQSCIRVLCCREIQNSIEESVHKLLEDSIYRLGVDGLFEINDKEIKCVNGSTFSFIGLHKARKKIKSYEGYDYCWIEEAEFTSEDSLEKLLPTIRKTTPLKFNRPPEFKAFLINNPELNIPEYVNEEEYTVYIPAEIWVSFNPNLEDDPVYKKFVINTPESCIRIEVNYNSNPFFPATLKKEMADCRVSSPDKFANIWEGKPQGAGALIYGGRFDKKVHVPTITKDDLFARIAESGNAFMSMDPHSKYYPYCLWMALLPKVGADGFERVIYNEFPTYDYLNGWYSDLRKERRLDISLSKLAEMIYASDGSEYGIQIINRFIDTRYSKGAGGDNVMTNAVAITETFKRPENGGLILNTPPEKMIDIQRANILQDLEHNKLLPVTPFNQPDLYVAPWCKNTIHFLELHREELDGSESEKHKDGSDALRILYAGMVDFKYRGKSKKIRTGRQTTASSWMG